MIVGEDNVTVLVERGTEGELSHFGLVLQEDAFPVDVK